MDRPLDALPEGTKLAGYVVGAVLGRGSFGITYLATDDLFPDQKFAIKEFLPVGIAARRAGEHVVQPISRAEAEIFAHTLASFRREALTLKELGHPNVVAVQRYIELNGTAYVVMTYEEGTSLAKLLDQGPLSEDEVGELLPPLMAGLEAIHAKNFVHRDLKPGNIYLRADGSPVLLDFGAAREAMGERRPSSLSEIVTPGYAPLEQYDRHAEQGAYTDIYALGATLYRCMAGRAPPDAITRHNAVRRGGADPLVPVGQAAAGRYSKRLAAAVHRCLEIDEHMRPQTIAALREMLEVAPHLPSRAPTVITGRLTRTPAAQKGPVSEPEHRGVARSRRVAFAAALVLVAAVAAYIAYRALAPAEPPPRANAPAPSGPSAPIRVFRDCPKCPEMVPIPSGAFLMGSPENEEGVEADEFPQHRVTIAKPYAFGKHEVTLAEWDDCVAAGGCAERPEDNGWGRGRRPVMNISWQEAKQYVAWLARTTGKPYRLPTEAEWEFAARAGTTTRFSWGNETGRNRANCEDCGSEWDGKRTAPVGSFPPNGFGLHDVHGNVWEWVEDCWNENYRGAPGDGRAWLSGDCARRVLRGGSWNNSPNNLRSGTRAPLSAGDASYDMGFRVARDL